jgi:beta-glucosidase
MRSMRTARPSTGRPLAKVVLALCAALGAFLALGLSAAVAAGPNVPYDLPVTLPSSVSSPSVDATAPYTPAVLSVLAQLEAPPMTLAKIQNVDTLLHDGSNTTCHNVGPVGGPVGLDAAGNPTASTLSAAAAAGDTSITVASAGTFAVGQTIWVDVTSDAEQATITGISGSTLTLAAPLTKAHASGRAVYVTLTTPSVAKICWTDAQGVLNTSGPNARGSTGPMTLMGIGASFDRGLGNAWGQTEGQESREFMVTGMFGPQTDLDRLPNWGRNLTTTGEDPYLSHEMVAAQINGMQGSTCPGSGTNPATGASCKPGSTMGAMSEMKHFVVYNGQTSSTNTDIQDQSLHELYMTPYEGGFVSGRAAATMCSYQVWRDTSTNPLLAGTMTALASGLSPYANAGENPQTWKLNESHFSCEHPLSLNYVLRGMWGSSAFVGSDYPATHSTSGILQGEDQEMPTQNGYLNGGVDGNINSNGGTGTGTGDATGTTCEFIATATNGTPGSWDPGCANDAAHGPGQSAHVGGLPAGFQGGSSTASCSPVPTAATGVGSAGGCTLNSAVSAGLLPLSVFNQSAARILYQEQRFGLLGCDPAPGPTCTNPGGIGADRTGTGNLPDGPTSGAPVVGTKSGDAAIVEKYSEEGATLLKNDGNALPLTQSDLAGGILVTGSSANHTVADPTNEASTGFIGRDAVNPLQQLKALSGDPGAFTFVPANDPDGAPIPASVLSTTPDASGLGGLDLSVDGGPATKDTNPVDHSAVNGNQLAPGHTYTWSGYLYVPTSDTYTFAIQQSDSLPTTLNCPQTGQFGTPPSTPKLTLCSPFTAANAAQTNTPPDAVSFSFNGAQRNMNAVTANVYGATVPSNPTTAGYTDQGLISRTCATGTTVAEPGTTNCTATESNLVGGTFYPISITVNNATNCVSTPPAAAAGANPAVPAVAAPCTPASFRLAMTRANGDIADAAAAAAGKSKAIVFVNTGSGTSTAAVSPPGTPYDGHTISAVTAMSPANVSLITAVAAANPNTIVVINSDNPVDTSWSGSAKSILEMWFAGQEGGTSTARILLGQANPSGHTVLTWPASRTDTIWGYNEPANGLYPGSTAGQHLERLNNNAGCSGTGNPGSLDCPPAGGTNESEGIFTGYRYFDKLGITPAFPFGFGLSYTTFAFSKLKVKLADDRGLDVSFDVKNTGSVAGADAAQVYVGAPASPPAGVQFAVRSLSQFERVDLAPGQSRSLTLHVPARQLSYWDETIQKWKLATGTRSVYVGDADALSHLSLQTTVTLPSKAAVECSDEAIDATAIDGDLKVPAGSWCDLSDVSVSGDVIVKPTTGVRVRASSIDGKLLVNAASGASDPQASGTNLLCGTTVGGDVQIVGSGPSAGWNIGGVCGGNTVGGDLQFNGNQGASTITGNTIAGDLKCAGNGAVSGNGNTASRKRGQCAGF